MPNLGVKLWKPFAAQRKLTQVSFVVKLNSPSYRSKMRRDFAPSPQKSLKSHRNPNGNHFLTNFSTGGKVSFDSRLSQVTIPTGINTGAKLELGIQYTYTHTYVKNSEHHRFELDTHTSPLSQELILYQAQVSNRSVFWRPLKFRARKTNQHETHKYFSDAPRRTIVPGTNPTCPRDKWGKMAISLWNNEWEIILRPQPAHTRQKYEEKYSRKSVEFALSWSIWGHIWSGILFIFLPCMWGAGVPRAFLNWSENGRCVPGTISVCPRRVPFVLGDY